MLSKEEADNLNKATWNKVASIYEERFMNPGEFIESYDCFLSFLNNPNSRVLEICCGPGNISQYLLQNKRNLDLVGIDIAPEMVAKAQKNNPGAKFLTMDCRKMENLGSGFNGIICGFGLPYLSKEDVTIFVSNCYKMLLPEAPFYLSFIEGEYSDSGLEFSSTGDSCYVYYYSRSEIKQLMLGAGFRLVETFFIPYMNSKGITRMQCIIISLKT